MDGSGDYKLLYYYYYYYFLRGGGGKGGERGLEMMHLLYDDFGCVCLI